MKAFILLISLISINHSFAIATDSSTGLAKILSVKPSYNRIDPPQTSCSSTMTTTSSPEEEGTITGKVVGALVGAGTGAIAGNQIAIGGVGTVIGAVTGLLVGGFAGNSLSKHDVDKQSTIQSTTCTSNAGRDENSGRGYIVKYSYEGTTHTVFMSNKPIGKYINVSQLNNS